jgi:hypothetical protein
MSNLSVLDAFMIGRPTGRQFHRINKMQAKKHYRKQSRATRFAKIREALKYNPTDESALEALAKLEQR